MISAILTPDTDSEVPVKVTIGPRKEGTAAGTASWESKDQTGLHGKLQIPAGLHDSSTRVQGSPAAGAVQQQLQTDKGSVGPLHASTSLPKSQNVIIPLNAEHDSHNYEVTGMDRIEGSPTAEALQSLKGDEAGHRQHLTTGGGWTTEQEAGEETPGTLLASTSGQSRSTPDKETDDGSYKAATDGSLAADNRVGGGNVSASSAAPEVGVSATGPVTSTAAATETLAVPSQVLASGALAGRSALLVAAKPSALLGEIAVSLVRRGVRVTIAVKHAQDGQMFTKKLQKHLAPETKQRLHSTACPVNFASQTSVKQFASAINASDEPLDILMLHTVEPAPAGRRWYTPEGTAGTAQVGFLGPATLLRLLEPKLSACSTSVLLTTSPLHRLGHVDDNGTYMVTSWAGASVPDTQLALLAYIRQLVERMKGFTVSAVDIGPVREQPLAGSLLRRLPPLHQLLHLLLPSAHNTAQLVASIAEDMLAEKRQTSARVAATAAGTGLKQEVQHKGSASAGVEKDSMLDSRTANGAATIKTAKAAPPNSRDRAVGDDTEADAGQEPPAASGPSTVHDSSTASMGAQHEGTTESAGMAPAPADTAGESAPFQTGEALGADIKLLEMLMQEEGETAATSARAVAGEPWSAGVQQSGRTAGDNSDGKALAASTRCAEAPAGAYEDSYLAEGGTEQQHQQEARLQCSRVVEGDEANAAANQGLLAPLADVAAGGARKSFRYLTQGLLATPMLTFLDHAGRGSWLTHVLSSITYPFYQLTAGGIVRGIMLMDWPVRAWLMTPAGTVSRWGKTLLGQRAARLLSQLQRGVPDVEGVSQSCYPHWVEVTPAGMVMDDRLGASLWQMVEESARVCT